MAEQDTTTRKPKRFAFFIDVTMLTPRGFIPSVVEEDEPGHSPMIGRGELAEPWYWGHDIATAKRICDEVNAKLGLTPAQANDIVISSIAASNRQIARQEELEARLDRLRQGLPQEVQESFWDREAKTAVISLTLSLPAVGVSREHWLGQRKRLLSHWKLTEAVFRIDLGVDYVPEMERAEQMRRLLADMIVDVLYVHDMLP